MNKITIAKAAINTLISIGVGTVFGGIAKAHTPVKTKILGKICVGIATFVLADMVSAKAEAHINECIDKATEEIKNIAMSMNN